MIKIGSIILAITLATSALVAGNTKIKPGMVNHQKHENYQTINTWDSFNIINESGYALDISGAKRDAGTNIQLWDRNTSPAQQFRFIKGEGAFYYILNEHSGKFIDVSGGNMNEGDNIHIWYANSSIAQKFLLIDAGNGYYYIKAENTNYYLAPQYNNPSNGHNVILWNSNSKCRWKLIKV